MQLPADGPGVLLQRRGYASRWGRVAAEALLRYSRALLLLGLMVAGSLISPHFLSAQNLFNISRETGLVALISFGMTLTMLTGGLDLSVGSVLALSSCAAGPWLASGHVGAGVAVALAVGILMGLLNGVGVGWLRLTPFIATYGTMNVARGLALLWSGGYSVFGFPSSFRWLGVGRMLWLPAPFWVMLAGAVVLHLLMRWTIFGRMVYAVGANPRAARYSGLPGGRVLLAVYALSGFLSALAGLVYAARVDAAEPNTGELFALDAITASALGGTAFTGGVGSIGGTVLGAVLLAIINNVINLAGVSSYWSVFFKGVLVVGAIAFDYLIRGRSRTA